MTSHPIHRAVTILVSAALLATLVVISTTAPASAGKPRCFGRTATIVGTAKADVIKGTAKADVIVARGGHDTIIGGGGNDVICGNKGNDKLVGGPGSDLVLGGTGHDKLHGQTGPDRLLGGPGDDAFDGGAGVDLCAQGTGIGPRANCERPPLTVAPPPPPPPSGPTLIPLTGILAVAYSDIDGLDGYSSGDVMIARLVDTSGDGAPGPRDTIEMGRYPMNLDATAFGDWLDKTHVVAAVGAKEATALWVRNAAYAEFGWSRYASRESYEEVVGAYLTSVRDGHAAPHDDGLEVDADSPSVPRTAVPSTSVTRYSDDSHIDVVLNYPVP